MDLSHPTNITNFRISDAVPALAAAGLWAAFAATLQAAGALERLGEDVPILAAFACAVAVLAYAVDAELRAVLDAQRGVFLAACSAGLIAGSQASAWMLLTLLPGGVVLAVALVPRAFARRLSSAAAASPGARPGAP